VVLVASVGILQGGCLDEVTINPDLEIEGQGGGAGRASTQPAPGTGTENACSRYCREFFANCSEHPASESYESELDCRVKCFRSGWEVGEVDTPNSIRCRETHAELARILGPDPHCFHSAEVPTGVGGCELPEER
jgi:hypothetical protein